MPRARGARSYRQTARESVAEEFTGLRVLGGSGRKGEFDGPVDRRRLERQHAGSRHPGAVAATVAAAEQLIKESLDPAKKQALADKAIAELPQRLN